MQLLCGLAIVTAGLFNPQLRHGYWTTGAPLSLRVSSQVATLLADGRVLISGGLAAAYGQPVSVTQLYDPSTRTWSMAGKMLSGRVGHTATVLSDGQVLVVGGLGYNLRSLATTELFDPLHGRWAAASPLAATRFSHSAAVLPDGRVLIVGGIVDGAISRSTMIFDPHTDAWQTGPPTAFPHAQQSAVTLPDGRILLAGGYGGGPEIFSPATTTWARISVTPFRTHPILEVLRDGSVLLATGVDERGHGAVGAETLDAVADAWTRTGSLHWGRNAATGTELPDGSVLVAGGETHITHVLRSAERYDPTSRRWSRTGPMGVARAAATATLLANGTVLVCGGSWHETILKSCEIYHP